jgi:hypothetical protein
VNPQRSEALRTDSILLGTAAEHIGNMGGDLIRLINLVEVLKEDLEAAGAELPDDLSDEQLQSMSEADIKQYYQQNTAAEQQHTGNSSCSKALEGVSQASSRLLEHQHAQKPMEQLQEEFPPQDSTAAFRAWFPALFSSRSQVTSTTQPKAVVVCFHSSGNAEDMFTSEGTGSRCGTLAATSCGMSDV